MIGQKGIPATHGGVERHVEELGARLVGLGHDVTVFTRPNYTDPRRHEHRGMRLVSLPTCGTKHLDAIVHSVLCSFACWGGGYDIVHYHAIGPCIASPICKLRGRAVIATIHGQDWRRGKWGRLASAVLRTGEWMALRLPGATICVSETLARSYEADYRRHVVYVPNGIAIDPGDDTSVLVELGLGDGAYILFAGRLVPEKGLHHLVSACAESAADVPLVVAGDSSHSDDYVRGIRESAGLGVTFAGFRYGAELAALFRHCALFVLPSDLEGLPIVLLEALAYGAPVLASDIAPNVEVLGENGRYFVAGDQKDLERALKDALCDVRESRARAEELRMHVMREYDWDVIARQTSDLYERVLHSRSPLSR